MKTFAPLTLGGALLLGACAQSPQSSYLEDDGKADQPVAFCSFEEASPLGADTSALAGSVTGGVPISAADLTELSHEQLEQLITAMSHLGFFSAAALAENPELMFEAADDEEIEYLQVEVPGTGDAPTQTAVWIRLYAGDNEIGVIFESGTTRILAEVSDGDLMSCKDPSTHAADTARASLQPGLYKGTTEGGMECQVVTLFGAGTDTQVEVGATGGDSAVSFGLAAADSVTTSALENGFSIETVGKDGELNVRRTLEVETGEDGRVVSVLTAESYFGNPNDDDNSSRGFRCSNLEYVGAELSESPLAPELADALECTAQMCADQVYVEPTSYGYARQGTPDQALAAAVKRRFVERTGLEEEELDRLTLNAVAARADFDNDLGFVGIDLGGLEELTGTEYSLSRVTYGYECGASVQCGGVFYLMNFAAEQRLLVIEIGGSNE